MTDFPVKVGDELPNNATLIAVKETRRGFVVLAVAGQSYHPYVTWAADATGVCFYGNYFMDIEEAVKNYASRD